MENEIIMNIREIIDKVIESFLEESTFKLVKPNFLEKMRRIPEEVKQKNFELERTFGKEAKLKKIPDFFQPHVELAYALGHRQLKNINRLVYKDSYYFPIKTKFRNQVSEGFLRISNHKANLSVLSKSNKDKEVLNVLSLVLMDNDTTRPENTLVNKVYLDELHFNQCSDEDMEKLSIELSNFVNGSAVYNMGSGIFNINPKRRSNADANYFDIDTAIENKKAELMKPSENNVDTSGEEILSNTSLNNAENQQYSAKEIERAPTKILSRSEIIQKTKAKNRAKKENEENKEQERNNKLNTLMDRVNSVHTIEYSVDKNGKITEYYVDARPFDVKKTIVQKVPVGKITRTFIVPTQENNQTRPEFGTYHYYINGLPYFTLKVNLGHGYPECTASNNKSDFSTLMEKIIFEEIIKIL